MSLIRAGGFTTLLIAMLTTAALTAFGGWYTNSTTGETIGHIMLWFPISLLVTAPVTLVIFPLLFALLGLGTRPSGRLFGLIGGVLGALIAGYAIFRFRGSIAISPAITFLALPILVLIATIIGVIAGFLFERMARRREPARSTAPTGLFEAPLPPPHPGDLRPKPPEQSKR